MTDRHHMSAVATLNGVTCFTCDECPRVLTLGPAVGLTVHNRGDFLATHYGGTDALPVEVEAS